MKSRIYHALLTAVFLFEIPFKIRLYLRAMNRKKKQNSKQHKTELIPPAASQALSKDPLQLYLNEISKFPVLSKQEEEKLSRLFYEKKDPLLAQALAQANLRFVVKIAAEYTRFGARLIDLIQEGNMGLIYAIKEFNPYKGARLITYAVWWIRGYIQEYLLRQYSLVRLGSSAKQKKLFYFLKKQQEYLSALPYTEAKTLPVYSGFKEKDIRAMRDRMTARDISLDQPVSKNSHVTLLDTQVQEEGSSMEEKLSVLQEEKQLKKAIEELKPSLNTKELFLLDKRLLSESPLTLREIGEKFSITREAVRQAENRLIKKIKDQLSYLKQSQNA